MSAAITHGFLVGGMRAGLDPRDILRQVGLGMEVFEDMDALVPTRNRSKSRGPSCRTKPQLNSSLQIGKHFKPQRFGLLGRVLQYGATFEQALRDLSRFQHLTTNIVSRSITRVPQGVRISVETHPTVRAHPSFHGIPAMHEAPLAVPWRSGGSSPARSSSRSLSRSGIGRSAILRSTKSFSAFRCGSACPPTR